MELDKVFFKITQDIINRFQKNESDVELIEKNIKNDRFFKLVTIFDSNNDTKLNPSEVNTVFKKVLENIGEIGDEFILDEKLADEIVENTAELKKNKVSGRELIFFVQNLFNFLDFNPSVDEDRYLNGNLEAQKTENGRISYYEDGSVKEEYQKDSGKTVSYFPNGNIQSVKVKTKTFQEGWFNIETSTTKYYLSGNIYQEFRPDGTSITYYDGENKQIKEQNNNDGSYISYYENGQIKKQSDGRGGLLEYYSNGQLRYQFSPKTHKEEGFYENGQLEYVIKPDDGSGDFYRSYYENGTLKEKHFKSENAFQVLKYDEQGKIIVEAANVNEDNSSSFKSRLRDIESLQTEDEKIKLVKELNKDNIIEILDDLKLDLTQYINENLDNAQTKQEINTYIEQVLKERFESGLKDIKPVTQVENKYYVGDEYNVKWKGYKIVVKNKNTKEKIEINTQELVKNFPKDKQYLFLSRLQNLPGEVLMDIGQEAYYSDDLASEGALGTFSQYSDMINLLGGTFASSTIVHELGHAIDHIFLNSRFSSECAEILSSFENEKLKNDVEAGSGPNYCATNVREFFAEAYTLMMLGEEYRAAKTIETSFPETFALVQKLLPQIRELPKEYRHRQDV